jgi:hypothetical protein
MYPKLKINVYFIFLNIGDLTFGITLVRMCILWSERYFEQKLQRKVRYTRFPQAVQSSRYTKRDTYIYIYMPVDSCLCPPFRSTYFTYRYIYPCNRPWRPIGLWDVEVPTFSGQSAHRWRWGCQPYASAALLPSGRFLVLISVRGWVDPWAIVQLEVLGQSKRSNNLIGNRTRDLPACTRVPQPITLPRTPYATYRELKI